jgi:hypothetical protein
MIIVTRILLITLLFWFLLGTVGAKTNLDKILDRIMVLLMLALFILTGGILL